MKSLFSTWMPILAHYRVPLLVATMLLGGLGVYLTLPTAPVSRVAVAFQPWAQSITFAAPHTLLSVTQDQTTVYDAEHLTIRSLLAHIGFLSTFTSSAQPLVAVSADSQWFALVTSSRPNTIGDVLTIEVWSLTPHTRVARIPVERRTAEQGVHQLVLSPDGQRLGWIVAGDGTDMVTIWDQGTQSSLFTHTYEDAGQGFIVSSLVLDSAAPLLFRTNNQVLEQYYLQPDSLGYTVHLLENERAAAFCTVSPAIELFACEGQGIMTVRRVADGQLLWRLPTRQPSLLENVDTWNATAAFSADQRYLLVASSFERGVRMLFPQFPPPAYEPAVLWDLTYGQIVQRFAVQPDGALMVAYSPDGQYVATFGKRDDQADAQPGKRGEIRVFRVQPQLPFLQPLCIALGLVVGMLVVIPWLWLRR